MAKKRVPLTTLQNTILSVLKAHPDGIEMKRLQELADPKGEQIHFTKRVRELYKFFRIECVQIGSRYLYFYSGERTEDEYLYAKVSKTLRARILFRSGYRCQMCGRTVEDDGIRLHVDHRVPEAWGGSNDEENLWALCSACNEGKKNYFSTFDDDDMKGIANLPNVHARLGALLISKQGLWVESYLLEFVANTLEFQEDWQKRLRELRDLGFKIEVGKVHTPKRVLARYKLVNQPAPVPDNPRAVIRKKEAQRKLARSKD